MAGSPYAITISAGNLSAGSGYGLAYSSTGQLTVNKAALTVTADPKSKTYDGTGFSAFTYAITGFANGDLVTLAPAARASSAGQPQVKVLEKNSPQCANYQRAGAHAHH